MYACRPESLGIAVGIVLLVVAIFFQYCNLTSDLNVSLLSFERLLVHELVLLLCDVNLAFWQSFLTHSISLSLSLSLVAYMSTTSSASTLAPQLARPQNHKCCLERKLSPFWLRIHSNKALKEEQLQTCGIILRKRILMGKLRPNATIVEDLWLEIVHQGWLI